MSKPTLDRARILLLNTGAYPRASLHFTTMLKCPFIFFGFFFSSSLLSSFFFSCRFKSALRLCSRSSLPSQAPLSLFIRFQFHVSSVSTNDKTIEIDFYQSAFLKFSCVLHVLQWSRLQLPPTRYLSSHHPVEGSIRFRL